MEKELNPFYWSRMLAAVDKELAGLESVLPQKLERVAKRGKSLSRAEEEKGLVAWLSKFFIRLEQGNRKPVWGQVARMEELTEQRSRFAKKYVQGRFLYHLLFTLRKHRKEIARFDKALRSRVSGNKEKLFKQVQLQAVLDALPIWLVNLADVSQVLPMEKELFDLAIIDEATQCDIASCLPILQRAKKAVIVGDPKQLRHVSFLSRTAQGQLLAKYKLEEDLHDLLNYRDNSILDLLNLNLKSQDQLSFLNEHFRSSSSLIGFSNTHFYNNSLSMMKELPHHQTESLTFNNVEGRRCSKGVNEAEGRALLAEVKALLAAEKEVNAALCKKIGILSPFRDQADFLAALIAEEIETESMLKHQLLVGTAYSFQGEERDVMLLSFALDDDSHHSAFRHLEKHDVFNVAITRARSIQQVFYSFNEQKLPSSSLLRQYIVPSAEVKDKPLNIDWGGEVEKEVEDFLKEKGFTYWKGYELMGKQLDFLVKSGSCYLGIDLIGFPAELAANVPLDKYQAFMRAGLQLFPLPYVNWHYHNALCRREIEQALSKKPGS